MKRKLSELEPGEEGTIVEVESSIRYQVAGMGIRKGKDLKVNSEQLAGGPIVIEIEGSKASLSKKLARSVILEVEE